MNANELYLEWQKHELSDPDLIKELEDIKGKDAEIFDRFRCELAFGTGGLRGVLGVGTNRMNVYTIGKATQGLANCLNMQNESGKALSVVIARDSRNKGEDFVKRAASVLAANGIKVYVFSEIMPTPALSFAVRYFGCDAGICVTASHNPAIYNGYKVYDNEGCQLGPAMADVILAEMDKTDIFDGVKSVCYCKAVEDGMIVVADDGMFNAFVDRVMQESLLSDDIRAGEPLKIIYTPLNGAGFRSVTTALAKEKCYDVTLVQEQIAPDGNFPTCPYPNPENPEAIKLALEACSINHADIMIAT
ncbi:MAG: phospho-sugar mutase, partial [Clostridia bacterium]|nr:phospho-sugar mutase [Clostridia bacterium]